VGPSLTAYTQIKPKETDDFNVKPDALEEHMDSVFYFVNPEYRRPLEA
jgi:hypothetical protein